MEINQSQSLIEGNDKTEQENIEDDNNPQNIEEEKKPNLITETESEAGQPVDKKEMETILLILNSYWLELIGSLSLILSICFKFIISVFTGEFTFNLFSELFTLIVNDIGLKWLFFIQLSQHLSIGFFCLTTFSNMFHETKNIKKFYISNLIKVVVFYAISVIILKIIIKDYIGGTIHKKIYETGIDDREKVFEIVDKIIDKVLIIVADFLSTYNTFIEKLTLGSLYFFLFSEPKPLMGKKMLYFRLLSLIPILYIIISLVIRALHNTNIIVLNEFISPILLGPKIVVYLFFISCLEVNALEYWELLN